MLSIKDVPTKPQKYTKEILPISNEIKYFLKSILVRPAAIFIINAGVNGIAINNVSCETLIFLNNFLYFLSLSLSSVNLSNLLPNPFLNIKYDITHPNIVNIHERINAVNAPNKAILKTKGINTKTSGTMTLTIGVLTNALHESQKREGVLYSACEMGFFEEVIFKEKDIPKFISLVNAKAMKISTINPFSCDDLIKIQLDKIESKMI